MMPDASKRFRKLLVTHAVKVRESAVASSNLSAECAALQKMLPAPSLDALQNGSQSSAKSLNALGESLNELGNELKLLEQDGFAPFAEFIELTNKRAAKVAALKKKGDPNALTEEAGVESDMREIVVRLVFWSENVCC
jgi:hypothetical protein